MRKMKCQDCKIGLDIDTSAPGVIRQKRGRCRRCFSIFRKRLYKDDPGKYKLASCLWRANNFSKVKKSDSLRKRNVKSRHWRVKYILKKENVPKTDLLWNFNFYSAIVIENTCHYCDGPISLFGHGLDRKDCGKGHRCFNVVPCCQRCNTIKSNYFSYEDMLKLSPILKEVRSKKL